MSNQSVSSAMQPICNASWERTGSPGYNSGDDLSSNSSGDFTGYTDNTDNTSSEEQEQESEYVPGTFEGPEKTLEVIFKREGHKGGLRNLTRTQLDLLCTKVGGGAASTYLHY
jgi:hypothetical protein